MDETQAVWQPAMLGLGGNVGDVTVAFAAAIGALDAHDACVVKRCSSVWRTRPWGKTDQPDFLNMAVAVATTLPPRRLLQLCLELERKAGRERRERWGPRSLDVDIIAYANVEMNSQALTLPHPLARARAFVLAPANEIDPDLHLCGASVRSLLDAMIARDGDIGCIVDRAATERIAELAQLQKH